jgi:hypothetical protein
MEKVVFFFSPKNIFFFLSFPKISRINVWTRLTGWYGVLTFLLKIRSFGFSVPRINLNVSTSLPFFFVSQGVQFRETECPSCVSIYFILIFLQISIFTLFLCKRFQFHETGYSQKFFIIIFLRGSNSGKLQVTSNVQNCVFNLETKLEST